MIKNKAEILKKFRIPNSEFRIPNSEFRIPKFRNSEIPKFRNSEIPKFRNSEIPKFLKSLIILSRRNSGSSVIFSKQGDD